jgi:hypothetical protein
MTMMTTFLLPFLDTSLTSFLYTILQVILKICLVFTVCHYMGWIDRIIHFWLVSASDESEVRVIYDIAHLLNLFLLL